jgi:WW domain-containing oxidoreductase
MKSPEQGAATQCYVATHPQLANVSGEYFSNCNPAPQSDYQQDAAMAAKLWEVSTRLNIDIVKRMQHY